MLGGSIKMNPKWEWASKIVGILLAAWLINTTINQWTGTAAARAVAEAATARAEATSALVDRSLDRTSVLRDSLTEVREESAANRIISEAEILRLSRVATTARASARVTADSLQSLISPEAQVVFAEHLVADSLFAYAADSTSAEKDSIIDGQDRDLRASVVFIAQLESTLILSLEGMEQWEASSMRWEAAAKPPLFKKILGGLPWVGAGVALGCLFLC